MNHNELTVLGKAIFPVKYWRAEMAELLGVTQRTFYRWVDPNDPQEMSDEKYKPTLISYVKNRQHTLKATEEILEEGFDISN